VLEPETGKTIADRYTLLRKLGEGGMGSVWSAHDNKLKRDVAIKLVTERVAGSERGLARFQREAQSVARLRSPYIAQLYDYGVDDGSPYIIMELLEGEDLKALMSREIRLSMQDTARIVVQVAKALHAAHSKGIVHRDLKPANVFVALENGEQICKVFDFGVAKALNDLADDGETTAEGVLLGTPRYMSPEQAHGAKHVDHRSDLWALGVIAYNCVTGRLPFVAAGTGHTLVMICTEDPPKPSDLVGHLPATVDAFFAKALAKDPNERYQDAKAMGTAFAELAEVSLSNFSLSASRPSNPGATPSWEGYPSASEATGRSSATPSNRGASRDETSVETPSARSRGEASSDGTLGPATTSVDARRSWLATPRGRLVAALAAAVAVGGLVAVALTQGSAKPVVGDGATAATAAPAQPPEPATAPEPSSAASVVATSAALADPSAGAEPVAKRARRRVAKPVAAAPPLPAKPPDPEPANAQPPKPKPKSKDGLDAFSDRF
jgi:serine/threonine-protein kinase